MALTTAESVAYTKMRRTSTSGQAVALSDDAVRGLVYITARELGLTTSVELPEASVPNLYDAEFNADYSVAGEEPEALYEKLIRANPEAEIFVACAAAIHKARLKYQRVLSSQSLASMDQVAPRGLLQYGLLDSHPLAALLVWRKWFYDLDNRAAQDTGYLFEPVIAGAIGGVPFSAAKSPVRRASGGGRQVDCLKGSRAYEIKLRITIAASGQGRWSEEMRFPEEAKASGLEPVLVVLDPTPNPKLAELSRAFLDNGGAVYVGESAWDHLKSEAGPEMAIFLEKYVRQPLDDIYLALDEGEPLPSLSVTDRGSKIEVFIGSTQMTIVREGAPIEGDGVDPIPDEGGDFLPGVG